MIKECVVLNGRVINIGQWDYQYQQVQVGEDEEGNPIYEEVAMNPLPEGAEIVEMEIVEGPDGGLYPANQPQIPTADERLDALEHAFIELLIEGGTV